MQMKTNFLVALAAMVVAPALFTGCGGPECGTGTTEQDGMCVPTAAPVTCDENTELSDGKCVSTVEEVSCAAGTELANGECVLAAGGCGEGTTFEDGACVAADPDLSQACAAGTSFDSAANACVADFTIVCGANTVEQDGSCVPDAATVCATGTMADADGVCVIAAAACGENTILDPNSNTCLVNDTGVFCGANTAYDADSDTCVPTSSVCDAGTTFDDMTGLCLPDATCEAGDVILAGVCVSPARDAFANADLATTETADRVANNDDPQAGGTATPLTLPAMGTEYRVAGTINAPLDIDGDGNIDQDIDAYSFTATAGQTFKVAVQPVAGPPVAFIVRDDSGNYVRFSTLGLATGAARQILLPRDGTYTVYVTSAVAISDNVAPIGDDTWDYVLSMEEVAGPMSTDVDTSANPITGEFGNLSDNLYKLTNFTGGELVDFTVDSIGANVERAVMQVWASPTEFLGSYEIEQNDTVSVALPSPDAYVFFDWIRVNGPNTTFSVSTAILPNQESLGTIAAGMGETVSSTLSMAEDEVRYVTFTATAGEILEISQTNAQDSSVELQISGPGGSVLHSDTSFSASTASTPEYAYIYSPNGGSYVIKSTANGTRDDSTITVRSITPTDSGPYALGDSISLTDTTAIEYRKQAFQRFTVTSDSVFTGSLVGGNGESDADLDFYDTTTGNRIPGITSDTDDLLFFLPAGEYVLGVEADLSATLPAGYVLSGSLDFSPDQEQEPNDTLATANPVTLPAIVYGSGGHSNRNIPTEWNGPNGAGTGAPFDYFKFTLAQDLQPGESIDVLVRNAAYSEPSTALDYAVYDSAGTSIGSADAQTTLSLTGLSAGDYYVGTEVSFSTSFSTEYVIFLEQVTPPQQALGQLADTATSSTPIDLADNEAFVINFDVNAGDFIELVQDNDQAGTMNLQLGSFSDSSFEAQSATAAERAYGYAPTQGNYIAFARANSDLTNVIFNARSITPTALGSKNIGDAISLTSAVAVPREGREFYSVTLTADSTLGGSIVSNGTNDADLFILDPADGSVIESVTSGKDALAVPLAAGTYILVVEADGSELATGYSVDLNVAAAPVVLDGTVGDTCGDAIPVAMSGTYGYTGDMADFENDYSDSNSCTGYASTGRDVVFKVTLNDGETLNASLDGTSDFSIWLVTDCTMAGATCVDGDDGGNPEEIIGYTHTGATTDYFLIADRYSASSTPQPFSVTINVQ